MRRIWRRGLRLGELVFFVVEESVLRWICVFVKVSGSCSWVASESELVEEVEVGFKET